MSVEPSAFNFSDAYRTLQPAATRELVAAREASHVELAKAIKYTTQVLDLCRLAYCMSIPAQSEFSFSFEAEVRKTDPQFSLTHDRAEAGRIAAILLTQRLKQGQTGDAIAVLATSFCGHRASVDEDALPRLALDCLVRSARSRRYAATSPDLVYVKQPDRSALMTKMEQSFDHTTVKAVVEALAKDDYTAGESLAKAASAALKSLFDENQRLAEEVDLLWWHIGDWSECLERPLAELPSVGRCLIAGADLAALIRILPGPYGAPGLLRRALGQVADQSVTLQEVIEALEPGDLKLAYSDHGGMDILPIHTAARLYAELGCGTWCSSFNKICGVGHDAPLTPYKLALQAFWERSLVKHSWAK
jgi:hypothetical protein